MKHRLPRMVFGSPCPPSFFFLTRLIIGCCAASFHPSLSQVCPTPLGFKLIDEEAGHGHAQAQAQTLRIHCAGTGNRTRAFWSIIPTTIDMGGRIATVPAGTMAVSFYSRSPTDNSHIFHDPIAQALAVHECTSRFLRSLFFFYLGDSYEVCAFMAPKASAGDKFAMIQP